MNDSRRFPWLSGLFASITIAAWLAYEVIRDAMAVIGNAAEDSTAI